MLNPTVAISVRQPWAWLIIHAGKDIENRCWPTKFRGPVLIHAAKGMTEMEYREACRFMATDSRLSDALHKLPPMEDLERGGIIGQCEIVDCVTESESPWFMGEFGFVIRNPQPLEFRPFRGALNFFKVTP